MLTSNYLNITKETINFQEFVLNSEYYNITLEGYLKANYKEKKLIQLFTKAIRTYIYYTLNSNDFIVDVDIKESGISTEKQSYLKLNIVFSKEHDIERFIFLLDDFLGNNEYFQISKEKQYKNRKQ
jgi:hypothetical protein